MFPHANPCCHDCSGQRSRRYEDGRCFQCGEPGHRARDCPGCVAHLTPETLLRRIGLSSHMHSLLWLSNLQPHRFRRRGALRRPRPRTRERQRPGRGRGGQRIGAPAVALPIAVALPLPVAVSVAVAPSRWRRGRERMKRMTACAGSPRATEELWPTVGCRSLFAPKPLYPLRTAAHLRVGPLFRICDWENELFAASNTQSLIR